MKLLHCADLHLDSPLRGLAAYEGAPTDEIRGATRRALERLVDLAVDEGVAVVVIAGDIYDGDRDDFNTAMFFQRQLARLHDEGIAVVMVYGNHDAANSITRRLRPPDNVFVFPHDAAATHVLDDVGLAFHGRSYPQRAVSDNYAATYPPPIPGIVNVGVLHTSLSGRGGPHQVYAPFTEQHLVARRYDYWALGHIHERYETRRDATWIVYPGNLQGRKATEAGPKGATIVTYDDGITGVEHHPLDVVRWAHLDAKLGYLRDVDDVAAQVISQLTPIVDEADDRLVACRVRLTGQTPLASEILRHTEALQAQLRSDAAGASGRVWIEKILIDLDDPTRGSTDAGEAISAVHAAIAAVASDHDLLSELTTELSVVATKLGPDLAELVALGAPSVDTDGIAALLPEIESLLVAQLNDGGS